MTKIRKTAINIAKNNKFFRKSARFALYIKRRLLFSLRRFGKKADDKMVIFMSFNGKSYSCTPKAVYEYMLNDNHYQDYVFVWAFAKPDQYRWLEGNRNTTVIQYKGKEYENYLIRSKYWITNYRVYDHIWPGKDQVYVQCWHGTPLKRLGYDLRNSDNAMNSQEEIESKYRTDAAKFSYLLSPSSFASAKFITAWNLQTTHKEDTILEIGYPRNDLLINCSEERRLELKRSMGLGHTNKKIILYAPTWRDNQHEAGTGYTYDLKIDFEQLREALEDDYIILFRVHYLVSSTFNFDQFKGFIYDFSDYDDINHLYLAADLLITDYSSVFFDYANLKKPMLFYMYDLEEYADSIRGFYLDLEELPGRIITKESQLMDNIKWTLENFKYDKKYEQFNKKYNYLDDGQAAERLVKKVIH